MIPFLVGIIVDISCEYTVRHSRHVRYSLQPTSLFRLVVDLAKNQAAEESLDRAISPRSVQFKGWIVRFQRIDFTSVREFPRSRSAMDSPSAAVRSMRAMRRL